MSEADKPIRSLFKLIENTGAEYQAGQEVVKGSLEEQRLIEEAHSLLEQRGRAEEAIAALFRGSVPIDLSFYSRLNQFHRQLGWHAAIHQIVGILWGLAIQQLSTQEGEQLLNLLVSAGDNDFFQSLKSLPTLVKHVEFEPRFAANWFLSLLRRLKDDLASGGFWDALVRFTIRDARRALSTLRHLVVIKDEPQIAVAACIMGDLRSLQLGTDFEEFNNIQLDFASNSSAQARSAYYRSWIETANRGKMSRSELDNLIQRMEKGLPPDQHEIIPVLCRILRGPSLPSDCFSAGMMGLKSHVDPSLPPKAKFEVVDLAADLASNGHWETGDLILAIQPIPADNKGTWQRLESFLVSRLTSDLEAFTAFSFELAAKNAHSWFEVLQEFGPINWLLAEMRKKDVSKLIGRLVLCTESGCRKLGFFFFDTLELTGLPPELFSEINEDQLRIVFYESQLRSSSGNATARFLAALAPFAAQASQEFQQEFRNELVFQAKNHVVACRNEFMRLQDQLPVMKEILIDVEEYFSRLQQLDDRAIFAMEIPGFRRADRLYARHMANQVSEMAEKKSVLLQRIKKMRLLYGRHFSSFYGGKLGESKGLHQFSTTFDIPRLDVLHPEDVAWRKLFASSRINEILQKGMA